MQAARDDLQPKLWALSLNLSARTGQAIHDGQVRALA